MVLINNKCCCALITSLSEILRHLSLAPAPQQRSQYPGPRAMTTHSTAPETSPSCQVFATPSPHKEMFCHIDKMPIGLISDLIGSY